ncbi:MAG TPA: type II secretion system F family protein [Candidatus Thermoplasmatota archaeon]|nr:type II secretion system F family protein [Candidatus Thermoplasmatota archaeon]
MAGLGALDRTAYNWLGERARASKSLAKLDESLRKAQMPVRAEAYLAKCMVIALATAVVSLFLAVLGLFAAMSLLDLPAASWVLVVFVPPMAGYIAYVATVATPASNAKKRAKNINQRLAYATNYIAAMASAGVIPAEIFKSLAKQDIYGEVAKEAAMIYKDLEVHGKDIVTSLRRAIDRTPSIKFQELLQGGITTITSGGDLTSYFRQKAARYQWENRVEQKSFIDTMGLMAETYVTSAVAGPLFLIVMVAIIVLMGSGTMSQLQLVIFLLLPVINLGFMLGLKAMIPEV